MALLEVRSWRLEVRKLPIESSKKEQQKMRKKILTNNLEDDKIKFAA
jgi:hypothetical protein